MTMFVRAIEGFVGRIVILLALVLLVLVASYYGAEQASGLDFSNQWEGFVFQFKLACSNIVEFFVDIYEWSMGR